MSIAERRAVPLNSRCSRKCEAAGQRRRLVPRADRRPRPRPPPSGRPGTCSVTTRSPPGRTVRRTRRSRAGASFGSRVRVEPGFCSCAERRQPVTPRRTRAGVGRRLGVASELSSSTTGTSDSLPRSSISAISTWIFWPTETTSSTLSTRLPPARARSLLMCSSPSLPGHQRDERTEVRRLDHGAEVALADLGHRRVGDLVDGLAGGLGRLAVGGTDVDGAVVLDRQLGAGVVLDLVDDLALGPDHLADLVDRDP